jgi:hypothetical protein
MPEQHPDTIEYPDQDKYAKTHVFKMNGGSGIGALMIDFDDVNHEDTIAFAKEVARRWNAHAELEAAAKDLHSIVDQQMGDTDHWSGEDPLTRAMGRVAAAIPGPW